MKDCDLIIRPLVAVRDSRLLWDLLGPIYNRRIRGAIAGLYEHVAREMALHRHRKILDVGSGRGYIAVEIAQKSPSSLVTGIDYSPMQVRAARQYAAKNGAANCFFHRGNAMNIPCADRTFDAAVSIGSIKHWPDPARGLREIYRVLKPEGHFIISETDKEVSDDDLRDFITRFQVWFVPDVLLLWGLRHVIFGRSFSETQLAGAVSAAGFKGATYTRVKQCPYIVVQTYK